MGPGASDVGEVLTRGDGVCQPGLTFAKYLAKGRKRLTENVRPSPLAGVTGTAIVHPETNAPRWVQRAGLSQVCGARAQKVDLHGGVLRELSAGAK